MLQCHNNIYRWRTLFSFFIFTKIWICEFSIGCSDMLFNCFWLCPSYIFCKLITTIVINSQHHIREGCILDTQDKTRRGRTRECFKLRHPDTSGRVSDRWDEYCIFNDYYLKQCHATRFTNLCNNAYIHNDRCWRALYWKYITTLHDTYWR